MVKIMVDKDKCNGCETCVNTCPVGVYEMKDGKSEPSKLTNASFAVHVNLSAHKAPSKSSSKLPVSRQLQKSLLTYTKR
jgi:Fe-S-cluster-containing hydrogenase component 2